MNNWFITQYEQIQLDDGFRIEFYTNVPCHLYCYWTIYEPWVHRASGDRRGLLYDFFQYFCFVSWTKLDQTDPGDTLFHSFTLDNWPVCETRWFVFHGTIADEPSPSVSPIFKKHNAYTPPPITYRFSYRRQFSYYGTQMTIDPSKCVAETFNTAAFQRNLFNAYIFTWHNTDMEVKVSIRNVGINNLPIGPDLASTIINTKNGVIEGSPWHYRHDVSLPYILSPVTYYALVIIPLTSINNIWLRFRRQGWSGPQDRGERLNIQGSYSIDGGNTWSVKTWELCYELFALIP